MKHTASVHLILYVLVAVSMLPANAQPMSMDPDSLVIRKGQAAYKAGEYREAIDLMRGVLANDSLRAEAHALIAQAYQARGKTLACFTPCDVGSPPRPGQPRLP